MGDGAVTSPRWRSDKRPATGGMVASNKIASNKMASVQKLQMFYHFKLFIFVAVFLPAERINCRQFNIILHHIGQIFFSEMCFPCTSHSMREEATTSIFSAAWIEFIAESRNPQKSLPWILEVMVSSAPCICLCSYAAPGPSSRRTLNPRSGVIAAVSHCCCGAGCCIGA